MDHSTHRRLEYYIDIAISIIKESFSKVHKIEIVYENDPETNESWICLDTTIEGDTEQIFLEYQKYTKKINKLIPWPEIGSIRFIPNIV